MATLREIREEAGLSVSDLAKRAEVDYKTVKKADERSGSIHRFKPLALLKVLNQDDGSGEMSSQLASEYVSWRITIMAEHESCARATKTGQGQQQ